METHELIKIHEVRKRTNLPLLKCRKKLIEVNFDVEKAIKELYEEARKESSHFWGINML